jgi:hypothetical protein
LTRRDLGPGMKPGFVQLYTKSDPMRPTPVIGSLDRGDSGFSASDAVEAPRDGFARDTAAFPGTGFRHLRPVFLVSYLRLRLVAGWHGAGFRRRLLLLGTALVTLDRTFIRRLGFGFTFVVTIVIPVRAPALGRMAPTIWQTTRTRVVMAITGMLVRARVAIAI